MRLMLGKVIKPIVNSMCAIQASISTSPYSLGFWISPVVAHKVCAVGFGVSLTCKRASIGEYPYADGAILVIYLASGFHDVTPI